jgi:hypothetical protein
VAKSVTMVRDAEHLCQEASGHYNRAGRQWPNFEPLEFRVREVSAHSISYESVGPSKLLKLELFHFRVVTVCGF